MMLRSPLEHKAFKNPLPNIPNVENPFFEKIFTKKSCSADLYAIAESLHTKGYAVLDFPEEDIDSIIESIKRDLDDRFDMESWRRKDTSGGLRLQDAWKFSSGVKRIACNQKILDLLNFLYGRKAFPFQTLNFPVGTEQAFHSDIVHFSSIPERYMCGVWVAFEDIHTEAGPLFYYPGSHQLPIFKNEDLNCVPTHSSPYKNYVEYENLWRELVKAHKFEPEIFSAKKGQALIWTANLLHGGMPQTDKSKTRWSQVTHYYFEDCAYYTPLQSLESLNTFHFDNIEDIRTGKSVDHSINGVKLSDEFLVDRHSLNSQFIEKPDLPDDFDPQAYLELNPDVANAGVDPIFHYLNFGVHEKRNYKEPSK